MTEEYKRQPLPEWSEVLAEKDAEIAALNHAEIKYLVCIEEKDLEIKVLRTRLEVDEHHPYDGIYCRDETIRLQDAEIDRLRFLTVVQETLIRKLEAKNKKLRALVQEAYEEGFQEGKDGGWIVGPSLPWKGSHVRAALSGDKHE